MIMLQMNAAGEVPVNVSWAVQNAVWIRSPTGLLEDLCSNIRIVYVHLVCSSYAVLRVYV